MMTLQLRPLSIGEMLDRTFSMYRDHFKLFVGIMVWPQLAIFAVSIGIFVIPAILGAGSRDASSAGAIAILGMILYWPIVLIVQLVAYSMSQAAATYAVSQVYLERNTSISASYAFVRTRFWPVILVVILTGVACFVGVFAFLIGALFAFLLFSLAVPVTVLEGRDPIESMKRSFNLAKDDLGRIFVIVILFFVLNAAVTYMVMVPALIVIVLTSRHGEPPLWVNSLLYVGNFVSGCLVVPLLNIALSVAYYDERVRKEALDMQFMMATLDRGGVAGAAAAAGSPPSA